MRLEQLEPAQKRSRTTRKLTSWIFVEPTGQPGQYLCLLGCVEPVKSGLFGYVATSTSSIHRHCKHKHIDFLKKLALAKSNNYSVEKLEKEVAAKKAATLQALAKAKQHEEKFFRKVDRNMTKKVLCDLKAMAWSIANGISRASLNCALFDSFLREAGAQPVANRHDLQSEYLPQLDRLVLADIQARLKLCRSVSVTADGWRDRRKRNWIDMGIAWTADSDDSKRWIIEVVDADLIYMPGDINGDVIETAIRESIDKFVPPDCLIATSTNDGAGDEQKAAFQLVREGNNVWCTAHLIQLVIDDCLDSKQRFPPEDCAPFRVVLKKAHDLVVFINNHRDVLAAFQEKAAAKRATVEGTRHWEQLIIDNDTRWDTDLYLIERVVYFDAELMQLVSDETLGIPPDCIFSALEFDLAYSLTLVLDPFREFTKFVQHRNSITLAHVPEWIDLLVGKILPGSFDARLVRRADGLLHHVHALQQRLVLRIRERFSPLFDSSSLALAARFLMPGPNRFAFNHFNLDEDVMRQVRQHMVDDVVSLLGSDIEQAVAQEVRESVVPQLRMARRLLDELPADTPALEWWPRQTTLLGQLFPLAKMLFAIPATSADNERSFSSASYTLGDRRTRMELEAFRSEHRIRRFIVADADGTSQEGRKKRVERVGRLLDRFAALLAERPQQ